MRFKVLLGAVEKARASTEGKIAEKACLEALREKYNIVDAPKRKKRKKAEAKASTEDDFEVDFAEKSDDDQTTGPQDFDDLDLDEMDVFDSDDELEQEEGEDGPTAAEANRAAAETEAEAGTSTPEVPGEVEVNNADTSAAV